ncbi:acyl-CoA dehydrogenase [Sphingomonas sp. So64.6b]|uniref:acyl-CoA dehydrogenase family protein n=1 Tax=Sphingomonas sp. So64.6b TaxID=2997354 RepID=UPI001602D688|nr:acyl-CoA dehydrogenase family protein [Sphingomonas sp. So64.6b]QNA86645.1 acyl-CoA dehydrogenase [Sphingomonas sp. So64.6b]
MTFDDTPEQAAYRATARTWIADHMPAPIDAADAPIGSTEHLEHMRLWQRAKAEHGYACIAWPAAIGGGGGTPIQQAIFDQEEARAGLSSNYFMTGLKICLPPLLKHGSDAQRARFIAPAVRGDEIWCQLFSEPSNGSDLAAARTRAVRVGDGWRIDGQKVWNSNADRSDFGLLLARTDPDLVKHAGLTMFWIDMRAPGVDVRPLRQMNGGAEFNEVYLDGVMLRDDQRVGDIGEGWAVALTTLANERAALGGGTGPTWRDLLALARLVPSGDSVLADDPVFGQQLAGFYTEAESFRLLGLRMLSKLSRGEQPGPEASAAKLVWSNHVQALSAAAVELTGDYGMIDDPALAPLAAAFQARLMWAPGLRIGGGTDEILRNIIAERVLGLPADARADKGMAFRDIPQGTR